MKSSYLKKIAILLREAEEVKPLLPSEEGGDSVDAQIDKLFVSYESEAKSSKNEGMNFKLLTRRFLLEAEDEEEDIFGADDESADDKEGGDDESDDDSSGDEEESSGDEEESSGDESSDEEEKVEKPEMLTADDIDVNSFASSIARLVDNYDSLLELRNVILRRAASFIAKGYEQDVVDAFKEALSIDYDMEIGETETSDDEKYPAPKAGFAGPAGGGGA